MTSIGSSLHCLPSVGPLVFLPFRFPIPKLDVRQVKQEVSTLRSSHWGSCIHTGQFLGSAPLVRGSISFLLTKHKKYLWDWVVRVVQMFSQTSICDLRTTTRFLISSLPGVLEYTLIHFCYHAPSWNFSHLLPSVGFWWYIYNSRVYISVWPRLISPTVSWTLCLSNW